MDRSALLAIAFALGTWLCPGNAAQAAEFPYRALANAPQVYVRSGPGENYYPTSHLAQGAEVEVYRHDPGGWYAIRPPEGSTSWIRADQVELLDPDLAVVRVERAPARVGNEFNDTRDVIQVQLSHGEQVRVLGAKRFGSGPTAQTWYQIAPPAGEFRWVLGRFLDRVDNPGAVPAADAGERGSESLAGDDRWKSAPPRRAPVRLAGGDTAGGDTAGTEDESAEGDELSAADEPPPGEDDRFEPPARRSEIDRADAAEADDTYDDAEPRPLEADFDERDLDSRSDDQEPEEDNGADRAPRRRDPSGDRHTTRRGEREPPRRETEDLWADDDVDETDASAATGDRPEREARRRQASGGERSERSESYDEPADGDVEESPRRPPRGRMAALDEAPYRRRPDLGDEARDLDAGPVNPAAIPVRLTPLPERFAPGQFGAYLDELDLALSVIVADEPARWEFRALMRRAEDLLALANSPTERGQVRLLAKKIQKFRQIQQQNLALDRGTFGDGGAELPSPGGLAGTRPLTSAPGLARYDGTGRLTRVAPGKSGDPAFALLDPQGVVRFYVTPAPGVNLRYYVGQTVGVTGSRGYWPEMNTQHLVAQRVDVIDGGSLAR